MDHMQALKDKVTKYNKYCPELMRKITMGLAALCLAGSIMSCQQTTDPKQYPKGADTGGDMPQSIGNGEPSYTIIPNISFHVLVDEHFENNDPDNRNASILIRDYRQYDGTDSHHWSAPFRCMIAVDKVKDIQALKAELLRKHPQSLRLLPNTIVSEKVIQKWEAQEYEAEWEYYDQCPKGLTYEGVQVMSQTIKK